MKKVKILAISPYEGMKEIMLNVAVQCDDIELTAYVGDLIEGVNIALKATKETDYDIIISRGGTAELIREAIDIPLLEVSISAEDILQAIKLSENYHGKFAIVGFPSIINQANVICDLLQYHIDSYTIHHADEVPPLIERLKSEGYSMILCDMIAFTVTRSFGLNAILINSSFESIKNIFVQAVKLCHSYSKISNKNKLLELSLKNNPAYTIVYNLKEKILFSSLDENSENEITYSWIKSSFAFFLQHDTYRAEKTMHNQHFTIVTKKVVEDGQTLVIIYLTISPATLPFQEGSVRLYNNCDQGIHQFNNYYSTSNSTNSIRTMIEEYSQSASPILILGEIGTGKDGAAAVLYKNGPYKNSPCYLIDFSTISEKSFDLLIDNPASPFYDVGCTIYFKNIGELAEPILTKFYSFIENSNFYKLNRVIFSFKTDDVNKGNHPVCNFLLKRLSCLTLYLLPLRQRTNDIPSLAALYINQLNSQLGKQIIGFEPEALTLMQNFYWQYNLDQFKRVLKELVITTNQFYISKEVVNNYLQKEKSMFLSDSKNKANILNLNQPLDDINYDIINIILEEENMNQKKAADRLGISRSTIWRISKSKS